MAYSQLQVRFLSPKCSDGAVCTLGDAGAAVVPHTGAAVCVSMLMELLYAPSDHGTAVRAW